MAPTFTYADLAAEQSTNGSNGLLNVANQAANVVCNLWQNYTDVASGLPDPTGLGGTLNGVYSRLCSPRAKQPTRSPGPAIIGGQCTNLPYNVTIAYSKNGVAMGNAFFPSVPGPLSGVGLVTYGSGSVGYGVLAPNAIAYQGILAVVSAGGADPLNTLKDYQVTGVTVTPIGHPDNCGNSAPQYNTPPPPSSSFNVGGNTVNIGGALVIAAPITLIPTLFKTNVSITPQIQVKVGPFDVTFDLGGVYINPNFTLPGDKSVPPRPSLPPGHPSPVPPKEVECPEFDATEILNKLNQLQSDTNALKQVVDDVKDCSCPVPYEVSVVQLSSRTEGGLFALPANAIAVRVVMEEAPTNPKYQEGRGTHPDNYFWGYFEFGDGNFLSERIPLNTEYGYFECPKFATTFAINLYAGYAAKIEVLKAVPEKSNSEFAVRQMSIKP